MTYTFTDHLHNYSVWTAARASQRGFTTTDNIKAAIDKTTLKKLTAKKGKTSTKDFDKFHRQTAKTIIQHLTERGIMTSYGRAAKIIAIYLKTSIVIRDSGQSDLAGIIHPPIDSVLLTNLAKANKDLGIKGIKWTQLTEKAYFDLIGKLRTLQLDNFWELEKHWTPTPKN